MVIRLKVLRKQQERINKIADLLQSYNINPNASYNQQYQPIGASSSAVIDDPRIAKTKDLFQMFHLAR